MNEVISQLAERKSVRVYEDREIDEAAVSQIIDTVVKVFYARKYNSDFAREMSRSVEEYWKQYRSQTFHE